jgi:maltooligosyltrehalose synthase
MKRYTEVNGVEVIEQQAARDRIYGAGSDLQTISTVLELLLANDTIRFGCNYNAPHARDCVYIAETVRSVTAHQRTHSRKLREAKIYKNRVNGANKAAQTKRDKAGRTVRVENVPVAVTSKSVIDTQIAANAGNLTADLIAKGLLGLAAELRDVAAEVDRLVRRMPATPTAPLIDANELDRLHEIERNYNALKDMFK